MARQTYFAADRSDLELALQRAETACAVQYFDFLERPSLPQITRYESLSQWHELGVSTNGRTAGHFIVMPIDWTPVLTPFRMNDGSTKFRIDVGDNPVSFTLYPSGVYFSGAPTPRVVVGKIATASSDPRAIRLYSEYRKNFIKTFEFLNGQCWVAANAKTLLTEGASLGW